MRTNKSQRTSRLNIRASLIIIIGLLITLILTVQFISSCNSNEATSCTSGSFPGSCTTFLASFGDTVLYGNNEDFNNPKTYIWSYRPGGEFYGGVYFGYAYGKPQGGMNEKGLAFDALSLPEAKMNPHLELPSRGSSDSQFLGKLMNHSANVDEAIAFTKEYNWGPTISFQVLLADASGDAVMISAGSDGELAFTQKPIGDGYLLGTNFNLANTENRFGDPPCSRYDKADSMLGEIESEADLNVEYFSSILDEVHVEGSGENTLYSNVFDLSRGVIYLYYWHQFDEVVILDVDDYMENGTDPIRLSTLFPQEIVNRAEEEYQQYKKVSSWEDWLNKYFKVLVIFVILLLLGIVGFLVFASKKRKELSRITTHQSNG